MDVKMIYLAARNPALTHDQWVERWRAHGAFCRTLPIWDHIRHYEQCVTLEGEPHPSGAAAVTPTYWDGVGMIWFWSFEALQRAIDEPTRPKLDADELETFNGPVGDTALLTREIVFRDNGGVGAKAIAFLKRKPTLSRAEFTDYWEHRHAPLFLGNPDCDALVRKYVQNHTLDASPGPMGHFDGVVEIGFATPADLAIALESDGYATEVLPDHDRFLSKAEMIVVVTDETVLYEDALGRETALSTR